VLIDTGEGKAGYVENIHKTLAALPIKTSIAKASF
jgi:hypothetical protein